MKTIRVIDLLNKIANGEEVHAKHKLIEVKYYGENDFGISYRTGNQITFKDLIRILNDEVEIIEEKEDKKIRKLEDLNTDYYMKQEKYGALTNEEIVLDLQTLKNYINEIIDKLNEMSE